VALKVSAAPPSCASRPPGRAAPLVGAHQLVAAHERVRSHGAETLIAATTMTWIARTRIEFIKHVPLGDKIFQVRPPLVVDVSCHGEPVTPVFSSCLG
jgi:hypothetical protein